MSERPFLLLDPLTRNFLSEFKRCEEAEDVFFRFVRPSPSAAEHLEIWHEDGTEPHPIDPEKLRTVTAG